MSRATRQTWQRRGDGMPAAVNATGDATGSWKYSDARDLSDIRWQLCTTDPSIKRGNNYHTVAFDVPVDYGGVRLSDPGLTHDLFNKRALVLGLLRGGRMSPFAAQTVANLADKFDWFVRWKLSIGVDKTCELRPSHFEQFKQLIAKEDILALVPVHQRLSRFLGQVCDGEREIPLKNRRKGVLDISSLAILLGVTPKAAATSIELRAHIESDMTDFGVSVDAPHLRSSARRQATGFNSWAKRPFGRSANSVHEYLRIWELLSTVEALPDPLTFDPFEGTSVIAETKRIGRKVGRTQTLHPDRFLKLMNEAVRWVMDYGPFIADAHERLLALSTMDLFAENQRVPMPIWVGSADRPLPAEIPVFLLAWRGKAFEKRVEQSEAEIVALIKPMRLLVTACAILVAGFGARRAGEVRSLRKGCLSGTQASFAELSIYIEKNVRDVDQIPVPATVAIVVELLERLSSRTRDETGREWLLEIAWVWSVRVSTRQHMLGTFNSDAIWEFMVETGLATPEEASNDPLLPHQLRRAFAVVFYHVYRYGSLDVLSRFMRHFDPEVTRTYVNAVLPGSMAKLREEIRSRIAAAGPSMTAEDRAAIDHRKQLLEALVGRRDDFEAVRQASFELRLLEVFDGVESPAGKGAPRLRRSLAGMVSAAEARVRLNGSGNEPSLVREPLVAQVRDFVRTHFLEPVPGQVAHCSCLPGDPEDLASAECRKERAILPASWRDEAVQNVSPLHPDFAFSSAYVCLRCTHAILFSENKSVVSRLVQETERRSAVVFDPGGTIAAHASAQRAAFEEAISA